MKRYFKYIAILLSFVMVFSLSGFAALQTATNVFAADSPSAGDNSGTGSNSPSAGDNTGDEQDSDWEYTENEDGTLKLTKYIGKKTSLSGSEEFEIPSEIEGKKVTVLGELMFCDFDNDDYCNYNFYKIIIPEGITKIEEDAFFNSGAYEMFVPKSIAELEGDPFHTSIACAKVYGYKGSFVEDVVDNSNSWAAFYRIDEEYPKYGDFTYKINSKGTVTIVKYNGHSDEKVTIPDTIAGKKVTEIGKWAFYASEVKEIELPDEITKIATAAFFYSPKLEKINIPKGVEKVGSYALGVNNSLKELTVYGGKIKLDGAFFQNYNKFVIKGLTNSEAEKYAIACNLTFESIGIYEEPTEPDTEAPTETPSETPSETETEAPTDTPSKPETPIDSDILDSINNGEKVVTKEVEAGNGRVVPIDFVAAAIEKGAQLVLEVKGADGNPLVKYTFDGRKFTKAPDANFKLDVACGEKNAVTAKVKEQLNTADENSLFLCDFEHSGELNGELAVTVYPNYDNGTELKLFYYNEATGKAEDMGQTVKVENGEVTFTVTHFSSYLLVKASDIRNDVTPGEPENPSQTEPGNNPSEPGTTPSETQPETAPSQTETEPSSTEAESGSYVAPSTGAGAGSAAAIVGVMLMACGAAGVCVGKRKK